jgi:hypothetical protein
MRYLILIPFLVSGCGLFKPEIVYRDRIKEVPVLVFNEPPTPVKVDSMVLPVDELKADASDSETAEAYVKSLIILKSENSQLREAQKPFQKDEK